ncbi:MAG TPA: 6-carboxytetrahydropterin synthase QueD [Thermoanaerobaculia bacterium]|nr:6-carboxytetrahydropterin synthase QueD [Thermoanaerobaculia bacterium]HUM30513.1 6-carboxytetrahydropterin synthase QueD [Thermoanaerobaculia bacterium]HXK68705.1 6-carboxytetrahydropterin synthase QueD [Thermoanaerobaculia bacterium]
MYAVSREIDFSSAHAIRDHQGGCQHMHGHNYRLTVVVKSETLNSMGMVIDFKDLNEILKSVVRSFDHAVLNEVPPFDHMNPTAENMARYFFEQIESKVTHSGIQVERVELRETPTACAYYMRT